MKYLDIVFDQIPGPESAKFVEVENDRGESVRLGTWVERPDGYCAIRITRDDVEAAMSARLSIRDHLTRPLVVFDVETTGTDVENDRIVQIMLIRIPDGNDRPVTRYSTFINPQRPIPSEATEIHGIEDGDVAEAPTFAEAAEAIAGVVADADLGGFNSDHFDIPMLAAEFRRAGYDGIPGPADRSTLDAFTIEKVFRPRTLANVYLELIGHEIEGAHTASADAVATVEILAAQIERYGLRGSVAEMQRTVRHPYLDSQRRFLVDDDGYYCLCFGKHSPAGRPVRLEYVDTIDPSYYSYMLNKFDAEAVAILRMARATGYRVEADQ